MRLNTADGRFSDGYVQARIIRKYCKYYEFENLLVDYYPRPWPHSNSRIFSLPQMFLEPLRDTGAYNLLGN